MKLFNICLFLILALVLPVFGQISKLDTKGLTFLKEFTSSGTIAIPSNVDHVMVEMWGAGGGGGGGGSSTGTTVGGGGGGGGGGAYIRAVVAVTPGKTLQILIGKGGTGGAADTSGIDGGDTAIVGSNGTTSSVLMSAGGGKGADPGAQNLTACLAPFTNPTPGGVADTRAGLRRSGQNGGGSAAGTGGGCNTGNNGDPHDCILVVGIPGSIGGYTTIGTITPPGSRGGIGGQGHTPKVTACGPGNQQDFPARPGQSGTDGYAIITY